MALFRSLLVFAAISAVAHSQIDSPINGRPVTVLETGLPTESSSTQSDDPSLSGPDQVFTGHFYGEDTPTSAGIDGTKPVFSEGVTQGLVGRKMLQDTSSLPTHGGTLQLSGSGVQAGDKDAGVSANAFGNGQTSAFGDKITTNHFEPHGVDYAVSADGTQYGGTVGVDPDGVGGEGPLVEATGRK